jgi:pyrophosphatase PpaX
VALHIKADRPFPGVLELLDWLRACGVRCGIVTGKGPHTARISLQAMGLQPYIEFLETGSPAGADKPAGIARILAEWGLEPGSAAYVGDVPYDMHAAREAGVLPIGAAWAATALVGQADTELVFTSVEALQAWLAQRIA